MEVNHLCLNFVKRLEKPLAEINQFKESQEKDNKDWNKLGEVYPDMPDIATKRACMKFGSFLSWVIKPRFFSFDSTTEKYRYYRAKEEGKDVESKAANLAMCDYDIEKKVNDILHF